MSRQTALLTKALPVKRRVATKAASDVPSRAADSVETRSATRLVPFGSGLMATAPAVPLTSAVVVPPDGDRNGWQVSDQLSVLASLQLVANRTTIEKTLDVAVGGYGVLSGVALGLDASYSKTVRVSHYSISFLVVIHVITQGRRLAKFELTPAASDLLREDPTRFARAYGDYFCSEKQYGGVLAAAGRYSTNSTVLSEQIKASLDANAVYFGAWGDVKSMISMIQSKDQFDFVVRTEGVIQEIPQKKHLATPDAFIKLCNDWIVKASANKTVPIRDYFTPYSAVPRIDPIPPSSDLSDFKKLLKVRDEAKDLLQAVLDIRANPDSFEQPPNEQFLAETREYATGFIDECEAALDDLSRNPLQDVVVPALRAINLPKQNKYSKDSIHAHLVRGYKIKVSFEKDIEAAEKVKIQKAKPYEVFIRETKRWYCIPPTLEEPTPKDVTTVQVPVAGTLWLWGVQFNYDNRGEVVHRNGTKGRIEVVP